MSDRLRATRILAALMACTGFLAGCGGGSDAETTAPAAPVFNMDAAFSTLLQRGASFDLTGTAYDTEYHETVTYAPEDPTPVLGDVYPTSRHSVTTWTTSFPTRGTTSEVLYYTLNPLRFAGSGSPSLTLRYVWVSDLPTNGVAGQSGYFARGMDDTAEGYVGGRQRVSVTWSLAPTEAPDTVWACLTYLFDNGYRSECLRIDAQGNILGARVSRESGLIRVELQ
jgi:hypothetical protein